MEQNHDILLHYSGEKAKVRVSGIRFAIKLEDAGILEWASEKYSGIESGDLRDLRRLVDDHDELNREGEFALLGFDFMHDGQKKSILAKLEDSILVKENGHVLFKGRVLDDVENTGGIDYVDRVGSSFSKAHDKHNEGSASLKSGYIDLFIDTYSQTELTDVFRGEDELPDSVRLGDEDTSLRYALRGFAGDSTDGSELSAKVIDFNRDYPVGPATLNLKASVTHSIDASFNLPDSWWDLFDVDEYSLTSSIKLDWAASTTLTTGGNNGEFELVTQNG